MTFTPPTRSKMISAFMALATGLVLLGMTGHAQATTIDSTDGLGLAGSVSVFGEPNAATWGQVISLDTYETQLNSFTFYVSPINANEDVYFNGYVSAWDSVHERAIGPVLYSSSKRTAVGTDPVLTALDDYQTFTFNTGALNLTQGESYILYLSASDYYTNPNGHHQGAIGSVDANPDDSGQVYFNDNGDDPSLLTSSSWNLIDDQNLAYQMTISAPGVPTPEPATAALAVMGLAGLVVTVGRRRKLA